MMMRWLRNPIVMMLTFLIGAFIGGFGHKMEVTSLAIPQVIKPVATAKSQADLEAEKYAVLSAVIKDMYLRDGITQIVIEHEESCAAPDSSKETNDGSPAFESEKYAVKALPELKNETINDFHVNEGKCRRLARRFDIPVPYVLVTDKDIDRFFGQDNLRLGWQGFYAKYKGSPGLTSFSNVGFDNAMTQALLTTANTCGGLCGAGHFVLLEKKNDVWVVKKKIMTWIS